MPLYEYACQSCGKHIDIVHGFNDEPPTKCSSCDGPLRKVFHPVGIVLKGSGFYKTDSRGKAPSEDSGSKETTSTSTKSDNKSTSKPESTGQSEKSA